jgi:hypothetical protein
LGPQIVDPTLPYEEIAESQSVLAGIKQRERKRLSKDAKRHLDWLTEVLKRRRVRKAYRTTLEEICARIAADESKRRGIPISARQIRRCYEELLPPRRGGKRET